MERELLSAECSLIVKVGGVMIKQLIRQTRVFGGTNENIFSFNIKIESVEYILDHI